MKKILLLFMFPIFVFGQYTSIPDSMFEERLIDFGYDTIHDGQVLTANIINVDSLDISYQILVGGGKIFDLTGIEDFNTLTYLDCNLNNLTNLDVSNNTALTNLKCAGQHYPNSNIGLNNLNLSQNNLLETLICDLNPLTSLDVSNNTALTYLSCGRNQLTSLDVSNNTALTYLSCYDIGLTILDLSQNNLLETLICDLNPLTSLDVSQNPNLTSLHCTSNQLNILDVSQNTSLKILSCSFNNLTSLDLTQNSVLTHFFCSNNNLMSLDLRNGNNANLNNANTSSGYLFAFDVKDNDSLFCISVDDSAWSANNWPLPATPWPVNNWANIDNHTSFSNDCNPSTAGVIENLNNFLIYPNPTSEVITISIENFNGNIQTEVYDLIGNRLQTTNETTISLRDYSKGIYILKVTYGDRVQEVKVIKD
ncbi:MAG: T9SS type A sorting domain-containing protein [Parvicellaceae bacterium]